MHDGLDQGEVFSPLLWWIFYDPLLCEIKRQESVCRYRLNSHFVSRTGCVESQAGLISFLAAGAFVDNTIWVGNSQTVTQHILDVASKFFRLNNISINIDKTMAILINCWVANSFLLISGMPISVAKKGESYWYLGIFLSTKGFSKPSFAKAHSDVKFFANLVLKKAISDKQFSYLVSSVLHPIVNYRTQFSFVPLSMCTKWDTLICKSLKSKSGLPLDFSNDALHHLLLYSLKTFEQIQAEHKVASVVCFANLVDLVRIFHDYNLSLSGIRANVFHLQKETLMHYGVAFVDQLWNRSGAAFTWATFKRWKQLDPHGPVSVWFDLLVSFINMVASVSVTSSAVGGVAPQNVLNLIDFAMICDRLLGVGTDSISVYTDGSLAGLSTVGMRAGAAVFFDSVDLGLGVKVSDLVFFTMAELQTIALALECVPPFSSVHLFFNSQAALDAYKSELEHHHIYDLIHSKNLNICWFKVKGHSGVVGNKHMDALATAAVMSEHSLLLHVNACYILAGGMAVFGNSKHFVHDIFHCFRVLVTSLHGNVNWHRFSFMWYLDMHMATGSTSKCSAGALDLIPVFYACIMVKSKFLIMFFLVEVFSSLPWSSSRLMQLMLSCVFDTLLCSAFCKGFMFKLCFQEAVSVFRDSKIACQRVVEFVRNFCLAFRDKVWLVCVSHCALIEKCALIPRDGSVPGLVHNLSLLFSVGVIKMLGIAEAFGISSGFHASCLFFAGIKDSVLVIIDA
ncbi:hypothetical protein G9A89_022839 [Geosiphon pyriformis]|nr:hypothetical protein G9A89_022839 [Geosiphon pyriformis]